MIMHYLTLRWLMYTKWTALMSALNMCTAAEWFMISALDSLVLFSAVSSMLSLTQWFSSSCILLYALLASADIVLANKVSEETFRGQPSQTIFSFWTVRWDIFVLVLHAKHHLSAILSVLRNNETRHVLNSLKNVVMYSSITEGHCWKKIKRGRSWIFSNHSGQHVSFKISCWRSNIQQRLSEKKIIVLATITKKINTSNI